MKNLPSVLFVLLVAAMALAGCVADGPDPDDEEDGENGEDDSTGRKFADLRECRSHYPPERETPIRCENELPELEAEPGNQTQGWECVDHAATERRERNQATLYWDPEQEHHAIFYNTSANEGFLSGILAINQTGTVDYSIWNHGPGNGTVELEALAPGTNVTVFTFVTLHSSDREELNEKPWSWRAHWSLYKDRPYPVRILETPSDEYIFPHARYKGEDSILPYHWAVSMELEGDDFSIIVLPVELTEVTLSVPEDGEPAEACF